MLTLHDDRRAEKDVLNDVIFDIIIQSNVLCLCIQITYVTLHEVEYMHAKSLLPPRTAARDVKMK